MNRSGGNAGGHGVAAPPIARFTTDLGQVWPQAGHLPQARLGLAVSGGPDSLALLLLAHAARPGAIAAATVDHGLRAENAAEAGAVAAICVQLAVPHTILRVTVAPGNIQAQARAARYTALGEWLAEQALGALATAHHADDQAETLLMRLNRAAGVAGLAGVRARGRLPGTADRLLLRPLLGWRCEELGAVVTAAGLIGADDASNSDDRFERVRLRQALAGAPWLDIAALAASATHLADADAALDWAAAREWREAVRLTGLNLTYRPQAPRAIVLRVLARIVEQLDGEAPRGQALARLFDSLAARQPASIGGLVARPLADGWSFAKAPRRKDKAQD